jgi:glycosyltransferase involved in cell wall biosynthesis
MDLSGVSQKNRFAVIIPVYNHAKGIADVITKTLGLGLPVFVVNDGSTDSTQAEISKIQGIYLLNHAENRGKGAAILTGFAEAATLADWAITMDADGQHHPKDVIRLIRAIPANDRPIIVGLREGMLAKDVPWTSRFGRGFSNFWIRLAGGPRMADSQSGFRLYPLPESLGLNIIGRRFDFEIEILVKARWKKIPVVEVPISVTYAPRAERVSHFRPMMDFLRNTRTFARLITRRVLVHPFTQKRSSSD